MKTLAQIRAQNALRCYGRKFAGKEGGELIKKLPALIRNDGLLAALAFCIEKGDDYLIVASLIANHLAYQGENQREDGRIAITSASDAIGLVQELASGDASKLRRATSEALALLNYMKRFVA